MTAEGCISLDDDPLWVLGTNEEQRKVRFVLYDDKHRFIFKDAQKKLGVIESHGKKRKQEKRNSRDSNTR